MDALINLLVSLLPLLYGLAAVNYQVYFVRRDPFAERTCTPFLLAVFGLHWIFLALRFFEYGRYPLVGFGEALNLMAVATAGAYLYVERVQGNKFTGAFLISLAAIVQLVASAALTGETVVRADSNPLLANNSLFGLHAVIALLGYTAFAVGAVYGIMYLLLYRALKRKLFGLLFERLPPLDVMANMGFWASFLGWALLTLAITLGVVMSVDLIPGFYKDLKFIATCLVWVVYGFAVLAYFAFGWRGARTVYLSLIGFSFAIIAMLGTNFWWRSFHDFAA